MMLKDLRLAQDAAMKSGAATPLGASAAQLYSLLCAQGRDASDFSSMFQFLEGEIGK
jgi:3-hydroxyisobutyrate dehydrogenase